MCWATEKQAFANGDSHTLRKDICQRSLVLHLKLRSATKNYGQDAEKYFDKRHSGKWEDRTLDALVLDAGA
jgi:hypothetical protein